MWYQLVGLRYATSHRDARHCTTLGTPWVSAWPPPQGVKPIDENWSLQKALGVRGWPQKQVENPVKTCKSCKNTRCYDFLALSLVRVIYLYLPVLTWDSLVGWFLPRILGLFQYYGVFLDHPTWSWYHLNSRGWHVSGSPRALERSGRLWALEVSSTFVTPSAFGVLWNQRSLVGGLLKAKICSVWEVVFPKIGLESNK